MNLSDINDTSAPISINPTNLMQSILISVEISNLHRTNIYISTLIYWNISKPVLILSPLQKQYVHLFYILGSFFIICELVDGAR